MCWKEGSQVTCTYTKNKQLGQNSSQIKSSLTEVEEIGGMHHLLQERYSNKQNKNIIYHKYCNG